MPSHIAPLTAHKRCVRCRRIITTSLLSGVERCVRCADYDPNDPDNNELPKAWRNNP